MTETIAVTATEEREKLFTELYKIAFPAVAKFISKSGGSFDEARDIFQDALIIYYEKEMAAPDSIYTSPKAYILGIAKFLWYKKYKTESNKISIDNLDEKMPLLVEDYERPSTGKIMHFLETTGRKCMDLLQSFYYDKLNMEELAENFGYSSVRSATVQKFKCLERLRDKVKENFIRYEDFTGRD